MCRRLFATLNTLEWSLSAVTVAGVPDVDSETPPPLPVTSFIANTRRKWLRERWTGAGMADLSLSLSLSWGGFDSAGAAGRDVGKGSGGNELHVLLTLPMHSAPLLIDH